MSTKSITSFGALALAMLGAGCGNVANGNPMAPSVAPAAAACPARFNFESSMTGWWAPSWPGGFVGMKLDGGHAHCGAQSLLFSMDIAGAAGRSAQAQYFFDTQAVSAATRSLWVYFDQAPAAGVRLQVVFVDQALNWAPGSTVKSGFVQGWNAVTGAVTAPSVAGLMLVWDAPGTAFKGQVWIDEINW